MFFSVFFFVILEIGSWYIVRILRLLISVKVKICDFLEFIVSKVQKQYYFFETQ